MLLMLVIVYLYLCYIGHSTSVVVLYVDRVQVVTATPMYINGP